MNQVKAITHETMHGSDAAMMTTDQWSEIRFWSKLGKSIKTIARDLCLSRNTVRKALRDPEPPQYQRQKKQRGVLEPFLPFLQQRAPEVFFKATTLCRELKAQGYQGGYSTVKMAVKPLRDTFRLAEAATVRFETPPGKQAQVDWGTSWVNIAGKRTRVKIFVMVLAYSRAIYVEFTLDETLPTLIACHERAIRYFGGITQEVLYDNPRTIVFHRGTDAACINPQFLDFCRYYGYTPRLCRPYRAKTKGKVESGVKYVKRSFLAGRSVASLEDLNVQVADWIRTVADMRIHGTVHEQPAERFLREELSPVSSQPPYALQTFAVRKVAADCLISFEASRYSVPWRYVRQLVDVQVAEERVKIYHQGALIADHARATKPNQVVLQRSHYGDLGKPRNHSRTLLPKNPPQSAPEVEIRSLDVYALVAGGELHG